MHCFVYIYGVFFTNAFIFYLVPLRLHHLIEEEGNHHTLQVRLEDVAKDQFQHHLRGVLSRITEEGNCVVCF